MPREEAPEPGVARSAEQSRQKRCLPFKVSRISNGMSPVFTNSNLQPSQFYGSNLWQPEIPLEEQDPGGTQITENCGGQPTFCQSRGLHVASQTQMVISIAQIIEKGLAITTRSGVATGGEVNSDTTELACKVQQCSLLGLEHSGSQAKRNNQLHGAGRDGMIYPLRATMWTKGCTHSTTFQVKCHFEKTTPVCDHWLDNHV